MRVPTFVAICLMAASALVASSVFACGTGGYNNAGGCSFNFEGSNGDLTMNVSENNGYLLFGFTNNLGWNYSVTDVDYSGFSSLFSIDNVWGWGIKNSSSGNPFSAYGSTDYYRFQNGETTGDSLNVKATLNQSKDLNDVLQALENGSFTVTLSLLDKSGCKTYTPYTYINSTHSNCPTVPLPGAAWLFGSALMGFVTWSNRRRV